MPKAVWHLKKKDVLLLYGEIGVGKTTFIKYLINYLQKEHKEHITEVPSPTFNLITEYKIGKLIIKHCDLYRIKKESEIKNLGIFENISEQILLVEWPEMLRNTVHI